MYKPGAAVEFVGSFTAELPSLGLPEIAFAGRSNVGKSSALNRLLGVKKAARVSARPGRTQAINLFRVSSGLVLADLPGYGFAKVPEAVRLEWRGLIERYLSGREELKLVVVLVDSRLDAQDADAELIDALAELEIPTLVVATKVDKLGKAERKPKLAALAAGFGLESEDLVPFSAVTGEGKDEVWALVNEVIG